jgi:hypothetical protein
MLPSDQPPFIDQGRTVISFPLTNILQEVLHYLIILIHLKYIEKSIF